ncbi:albumin-binding GA domain-containing protein, partial [Atopobacter phocae]|uniref:albumin-binding GA domain-containing protein n=1 Tax=Atopobacter phocae TaxID=136492 RepID=UPI000556C262
MNNISKQPKYTIRKLSVGVASCFIGFTFLGIDSTLIQADDAIVALEAGQRSIDEIREEALKKINELDNAPREKFKTNYPYNTTADDPFAADIGGMDNFIKSAQTEDDISSALKAAESLVLERKLEIVHSDAKNFSEKINSKNIITPEANKQFSEAYAKLCESSKHLKDSYQNVKSLNALFNTDKSKFLTQYNKIVEENTEILNKNLNARIDFEEKEGDIYLKQIDTITNNAKSSIRLAMPYSNKSNVKELVDKINEKLNLPVANINDYFEIYNNIQKLDDFVNEEKIKEKIQKNVVEYANKVIDQSELHKENNAVAAEQKKLKKMLDNQVKDYENIKSQSVKLAKVIEYNIDLRKEKDAAKSKLKDADIATKHFISVIDNTQSIDSLKELVDQLYEPKLNESKEKALKRLEKANITGQYFKDLINNAKTIPAVNALTEEIYITKLNEVKEKAIKALADADVTRKYFTDLINNSNSIPAIKSLTNSIIESKNSQKGMTPPEKDGENSDKPGT